MFQNDLPLRDVINTEDWRSVQESLSEALEITLRTIYPDGSILETTRNSRICDKIISGLNVKDIDKETGIKCPFGLEALIIPIKAAANRVVAYVVLGPMILKARKSISEYARDAEQAGIKLEELMDALIDINVFSYTKLRAIVRVIEGVFFRMAQAGYHKKRLGEIAPEVVELDEAFSRYYEEKILTSLLDACTLSINADSGSVMTLDKNTNILHIKVSSKLDEKVVNNTAIKIGEGIAGYAVATAQPIILPKDESKNGLTKNMRRRNINSSMIVPFKKGNSDEAYGVINLNIARKNVDFSEKDIALVKELVRMASIALIPFQKQAPEK